MYKIGLVGLPNVGKSSIFNFLTGNNALISNRPFSTINPNISLFEILDLRLEELANYHESKIISFSSLELIDIAGLIEGSHEKSHGGVFFSKMKELDLIIHVIRSFSRNEIFHISEKIDPIKDFEIINMELILHDYQQIENIIKKSKNNEGEEISLLEKIAIYLGKGVCLKEAGISQYEKEKIKKYNLLTMKPTIILINCDEDSIESEINKNISREFENNNIKDKPFFFDLISAKNKGIEIEEKKKKEKINSLGEEIKKKLNLKSFFTAGKKETKSWLAKTDMNAHECSGLIHSEIKKRFVRLEVYNYQDWKKQKNLEELKKRGIVRREKKTYAVNDGDICLFI